MRKAVQRTEVGGSEINPFSAVTLLMKGRYGLPESPLCLWFQNTVIPNLIL